jgi:hypothetical protein
MSKEGVQQVVAGPRLFLFGGISAQVAAVFTNPIDVVKIRLQLQGRGAKAAAAGSTTQSANTGLIAMFFKLAREEGVTSLWKGITPSLLRECTYSSFRLGAYEPIRNLIVSEDEQLSGSSPIWKKFAAGATTGAIGSALANPIDLVKVRQQADIANALPNTFVMLRTIWHTEGMKGLLRGVVPTMQRGALLTATQLGTYDQVKHYILDTGVLAEGSLLHFCSGCIAGLAVAVVTSPVDTIRTRLMSQPVGPDGVGMLYSGSIDCAIKTCQVEGPLAVYKGFTAQWLRVGPHTTISLVCFEFLRRVSGMAAI